MKYTGMSLIKKGFKRTVSEKLTNLGRERERVKKKD